MIGLRNRIVHDYNTVSDDKIYKITRNELNYFQDISPFDNIIYSQSKINDLITPKYSLIYWNGARYTG